jgi:hypothetical protein
MAYTTKEATRVLNNPSTKQLINWLDAQSKFTKILMSPQFFHKSYTARDREVICEMIRNFYPGSTVQRVGTQSVTITF